MLAMCNCNIVLVEWVRLYRRKWSLGVTSGLIYIWNKMEKSEIKMLQLGFLKSDIYLNLLYIDQ